MLAFSLPLVLSSFLALILTLSDRYIIQYFGNFEDTGIYTLAYKISNIIRVFVIHSFAQAYIPVFYRYMEDQDSRNFYVKSVSYYTFVASIIALALTIFGQEAIQIVAQSEDYYSAYKLLPYLVIGVIFAGLRQILVLPINKHKKTKLISIITISAGCFNLVLNILLVPLMGARGAALATGLANLFVVIFYYYFVNKLEKIRYEDKKIINAIGLTIILSAIALAISDLDIYYRLAIKIILFASFPLILFLSGYYDKEEIHQIKHALGQLKNKYVK
jgi:O-antigen/teichoic acid export membrane protein